MDKLRVNKFRRNFQKNGITVKEQLQKIQSEIIVNPSDSSGVYVIHSKINDFIYIGSAARTFSLRWAEHCFDLKMLRHTNGNLQFLYCKYGINNLDFYIIEDCSPKDCLGRESFHVNNLIPEINLNALLGTIGFDSILNQKKKEWYSTNEGRQYKKNTLFAKREKWINTPVGRNCAQQDIKNLRDRLNQSNKTLNEKSNEILEYCREYFPDLNIPNETLEGFINYGTQFEPIWSIKHKTKTVENKPTLNNLESKVSPIKIKAKSKSEIKKEKQQIAHKLVYGCYFIVLFLVFLLIIWILSGVKTD